MKICALGLPSFPRGRHNLKDPRLDTADKLVEAKKKSYAQVDVVGDDELVGADAVLTNQDGFLELIFQDVDFIETRLGRGPTDEEKASLLKLKTQLEADKTVLAAGLTPEEMAPLAIHGFVSNRPIIVATPEELAAPEALVLRAFQESGFISFLTVGGKENRAWPIRAGMTAWEAAGTIHTDIQKGFIRAEIISYADFIEAGGETEAKRAGKQRLELKTYVMQDYDLVNFRFNK